MLLHTLKILDNEFTIHRFGPTENIPATITASEYFWIGKTDTELSVVCDSTIELNSTKSEAGWIAIKVRGQIDFSEIGVIAGITTALAAKRISVFVISTFDTDYILVKVSKVSESIETLMQAGYLFAE